MKKQVLKREINVSLSGMADEFIRLRDIGYYEAFSLIELAARESNTKDPSRFQALCCSLDILIEHMPGISPCWWKRKSEHDHPA
jgi:hypothetical protein